MSAKSGEGTDILLDECEKFAYESEWHFPPDATTDQHERTLAGEIIREKMLRVLDDEIPHGVAVVIEDFAESRNLIKIRAEIYCERSSHKGIIIGKNGETLKKIGTYAREDLEKLLNSKVFIDLWVKVKVNWRDSEKEVRSLGFDDN
jgi:GTP-binding protein Era